MFVLRCYPHAKEKKIGARGDMVVDDGADRTGNDGQVLGNETVAEDDGNDQMGEAEVAEDDGDDPPPSHEDATTWVLRY